MYTCKHGVIILFYFVWGEGDWRVRGGRLEGEGRAIGGGGEGEGREIGG